MKKKFLLILITLSLNATIFEDASKLYKEKKYIKSFKLYEKLAISGNANAQYNIGLFYDKGLGVQKDKKLALIWIISAAQQNHKLAQNKLGIMYEKNYLPDVNDTEEALKLYLKSANQDYEFAQVNLAMHYSQIASENSMKKAAYWYKKAAKNNNIVAINNLANMYYFGNGVKKSYKEAARLYTLGTKQNDMLSQYNLSMMFFIGEYYKKDPIKSLFWLKKSAKNNYYVAQVKLANFYKEGNNILVDKNHKKALYWYFMAAKQNYAPAQYYVGYFYYYGYAVEKDLEIASYWLNKSKDNGYKSASDFIKRKSL